METKYKTRDMQETLRRHGLIVKVGNKEFITYGGLLYMAKRMGLTSIVSRVVYEDYENGRFCFTATVKGVQNINNELVPVEFTDEGDASLKNVNNMIRPHVRRMASTRAIVRALRLFTGTGMAALEELGGDK